MKILIIILTIIFIGCGYRPISYYAKQTLGINIYVNANISLSDPENTVIAKDALNRAISTRLQSNLTSKDNADTIINIDMTNINIYSIADGSDGFSDFYRASVELSFTYTDKLGRAQKFINTGNYDFPVDRVSIITDDKRFFAINQASIQAIDRFIAQVVSNWR